MKKFFIGIYASFLAGDLAAAKSRDLEYERSVHIYMRTIKYIIIILLFSVQFACKQTSEGFPKDPNVAVKVDLEHESTVSYSDIFSEIKIIALETNDESVCGVPQTFLVKDDSFYILPFREESVFVFDKDGLFIKNINKKGQGPGEYTDLYDVNFNRYTNNLELLSTWGSLVIYDSTGKHYIETLKIGEVVHFFANLTEDIYVFFMDYRKDNKMFFYSKQQGKIIGETFSRPNFIYSKTLFKHSFSPFYVYKDTLCFYDGANGDIFTIDPDSLTLKPRHQWDFGKYNFDVSLLNDDDTKDMKYYMEYANYGNDQYAFCFVWNAENSNYFITTFRFHQDSNTIIYNKKTKKSLFFNHFAEGGKCMPHFLTDEYMYTFSSLEDLPLFISEKMLDEENRNKLKQITPDDNYIIIRYKFKNND